MLGDQDLDERLAGHAESTGLSVQGMNHPDREVNVDSLLLVSRPACLGKIKVFVNIFTGVEFLVELFSFHTALPLPCGSGVPK